MKLIDFSKLIIDLAAADEEAKKIDVADTGTCNMDSVLIELPNTATTRAAVRRLGLPLIHYEGDFWFVRTFTDGQGERRTLQVEAASNYLNSQGWETFIYYQMD